MLSLFNGILLRKFSEATPMTRESSCSPATCLIFMATTNEKHHVELLKLQYPPFLDVLC